MGKGGPLTYIPKDRPFSLRTLKSGFYSQLQMKIKRDNDASHRECYSRPL